MDDLAPDDVDRLYAALRPIEPPSDFLQRVALATHAQPTASARSRRLWLALDAAALVLLALVSVWFGMALEETGALDVLALLTIDAEAVGQSFGDVAAALVAALPLLPGLALVANVAAVAALSALALAGSRRAAPLGA
jgi:hypothetical protein